ncbi:MAG: T9SS type A sorting domain-containing protein [Sphingobacteriaceae bacterium]|nr:T9SS type A sorting domain-containing protein [Sphingobacteriaceae bacterium]
MTASGSNTYTWYPSAGAGSSVSISPTVTTTYTVVGTSSVNGCSNSNTVTQAVVDCTRLEKYLRSDSFVDVYPNPSLNVLNIIANDGKNIDGIIIMDVLGRKVLEQKENTTQINIEGLNKGIYQLQITTEGKS